MNTDPRLILVLASIALWAWPAVDAHADAPFATSYGGTAEDYAYAIQQTSDGGYVVAGQSHSFGPGSVAVWVQKLNANGSMAWQKSYGGMGHDYAYAIQQTDDGGYVAAGSTRSFGAFNNDVWVLKLNAEGGFCAECALGEASTATAADSSATVYDTDAIPNPICVCLEPDLSVTKIVTPSAEVSYHGTVTYTVMLDNSGPVSDTHALLTDTLPVEVDFARWVQQPAGAEVVAGELTWQGTITGGEAITFTFIVSHAGDYGDVVGNTARFSGTLQAGKDSATFTVTGQATHFVYLPLVIKNR